MKSLNFLDLKMSLAHSFTEKSMNLITIKCDRLKRHRQKYRRLLLDQIDLCTNMSTAGINNNYIGTALLFENFNCRI